jgi:hypothetical protein
MNSDAVRRLQSTEDEAVRLILSLLGILPQAGFRIMPWHIRKIAFSAADTAKNEAGIIKNVAGITKKEAGIAKNVAGIVKNVAGIIKIVAGIVKNVAGIIKK